MKGVCNMVIKNLTKRTSKAMYLISKAHEDLQPLLYELKVEDDLKCLLDNLKLLDEARKELVMLLALDNNIEIEG